MISKTGYPGWYRLAQQRKALFRPEGPKMHILHELGEQNKKQASGKGVTKAEGSGEDIGLQVG